MRKLLLSFISILVVTGPGSGAGALEAECDIDADMLGAVYSVRSVIGKGAEPSTSQFGLWRRGDQVAHANAVNDTFEVWGLERNGQVRLDRYFDAEERVVEYYPADLKSLSEEAAFDVKRALVSPDVLAGMERVSEIGEGCNRLVRYRSMGPEGTMAIDWLPAYDLARRRVMISDSGEVRWSLDYLVTEPAQVHSAFDQRKDYDGLDFADIGDMENDPFVQRMTSKGLIEHPGHGAGDAH